MSESEMVSRPQAERFSEGLMYWHREHNGRELPWKGEKEPYRIWLSEIILQQTRAEQGLPYYLKFVAAYPCVEDLAAAKDDEAFKLWEGLGYYARCRNMLATARQVESECKGVFPNTYAGLLSLRGVGPYTAAAIASFAFGLPHAVVDGNVYRVLARYFGITTPTDGSEGKKLFQSLADSVLDRKDPGGFNQAMMDHGATICTPVNPKCGDCPVAEGCIARKEGLIELLPLRARRVAVRSRYFHYLLLKHEGYVWIQRRSGKDVWRGLYEPLLIESDIALDRQELKNDARYKALSLQGQPEYEGELTQRLTHQLIQSRFFSIQLSARPALENEGIWVAEKAIKEYAFPRSLVTFFEKNGYF
jgi:A/G-specific adenine glycosylase